MTKLGLHIIRNLIYGFVLFSVLTFSACSLFEESNNSKIERLNKFGDEYAALLESQGLPNKLDSSGDGYIKGKVLFFVDNGKGITYASETLDCSRINHPSWCAYTPEEVGTAIIVSQYNFRKAGNYEKFGQAEICDWSLTIIDTTIPAVIVKKEVLGELPPSIKREKGTQRVTTGEYTGQGTCSDLSPYDDAKRYIEQLPNK